MTSLLSVMHMRCLDHAYMLLKHDSPSLTNIPAPTCIFCSSIHEVWHQYLDEQSSAAVLALAMLVPDSLANSVFCT